MTAPPIDTPVEVWQEGYKDYPKRFYSAGEIDQYGGIVVFADGKTYWSSGGETHYCSFEHWRVIR